MQKDSRIKNTVFCTMYFAKISC